VSQVAFDSGIRLLEITESSRSLEDSLLALTSATAEFASAAPTTPSQRTAR
jgi:ABC-2 type transport system ATP-binding protein